MITLLKGFPKNVVAIEAISTIDDDDYKNVLIPNVETAMKENDKVNILYHAGKQFTGFTMSAMWDDFLLGAKHIGHWGKVAIVTDKVWFRATMKVAGFVYPYHIRLFDDSHLKDAKEWVTL